MDNLSATLRLLTASVGGSHPVRLATGLTLGFFAHVSLHILTLVGFAYPAITYLDQIGSIPFMVAGAIVFLYPFVSASEGVPEKTLEIIATVDRILDKAGVSQAQRRLHWVALLDRYIRNVDPQLRSGLSIKQVGENVQAETNAGP